ncbi:MAG: hypothetical protein ACLTT1_01715 [[Clostridium] scindens]
MHESDDGDVTIIQDLLRPGKTLDYPIAPTHKAADQGSNYYLGQDSDQETPV